MASGPSGARIGPVDRFIGGWMRLAHARPWGALGILAVLLALSALVMPRMGVDADSSNMLSADLPSQRLAAELNDAFPGLKNGIIILVQAPQADAADLAAAALVARLGADPNGGTSWIESVLAPSVDPFFAAHGFLYQDTERVEAMFSQISKSANLLAGLRADQTVEGFLGTLDQAAALASRAEIGPEGLDPLFAEAAAVLEARNDGHQRTFGWESLMEPAGAQTADGDATAAGDPVTRVITVDPRLDTTRVNTARPALDEIEAAIAALPPEITAPVEIGITGEPALRTEEAESVFKTIEISTILSLVLVAIVLRTGLRATGRSVVGMISLFIGIVLTSGFAAVTVGTLNLISVAFVVLVIAMGVEYAIHTLSHIAEVRRRGVPPGDAVYLTGAHTGMALVLDVTMAALAFLTFATTDFVGMGQLGIIGGGGILISLAVTLTLIPAVIALRPRTAGTVDPRPEPMALVGRRWRALPFVVLAIAAAALYPALHVRFDPDPMALRDPAAPSVQAFRTLEDSPRTTPYRASVLAPSAAEAAEIAGRFEGVPEVAGTVTIQSLIPEDQDAKLMLLDIAAPSIEHAVSGAPTELVAQAGDAPAMDRLRRRLAELPDDAAAERLSAALASYQQKRTPATDAALQQDLFRSFPLMIGRLEAMLTADYVTEETLPAQIRARYVSPEGVHRVEILPEERLDEPSAMARFVDAVQAIVPDAAGGPMQLEAAGRVIGQAMLQATLLTAAGLAVVAWLATRRLVDTAAIMVPLIVGGVVTAAASVLLDMPFNYANVIVLPLMIGLGVASGVHIAIRERRAPGAVFATSTPRAVLFSALTTIAGFGTLAISHHRGTESMGVLLSISVIAAVGAVLGLTPALMRFAAHFRRRRLAPR
jgi:hopanoid biosynthesis associated RND transporter like protein HpnN